MYAIIEIGGKQYKVEKDKEVFVDKLDREENQEFDIETVLLYADGEDVKVGQPYCGVKVKAQYLGNVKGDKVRGIKFKKRKGYQRTLGHRQVYSQLMIKDFVVA